MLDLPNILTKKELLCIILKVKIHMKGGIYDENEKSNSKACCFCLRKHG